MHRFVLFMIPLALVAASDQAPSSKTTTKKPAAAAAKSGSITIPPDAVQIGPQVYRYKDANGKNWLYRLTPFGISKVEDLNSGKLPESVVSAPPPADSKIKVTAIDKGDSVRFEQQTPMGPHVWERKKTELTKQESAWLEQNKNGSSGSADKPEK